MTSPALSRRALIASTATVVASAALAVPFVNAAQSTEVCELPIDPETDGLVGLPLAAVHIDRAVAAMAGVTFGRWQVSIVSGDRDQWWGFKQINPNRHDPIIDAIKAYEDGITAFDTTGIPDRVGFTEAERAAVVEATYGPPLEVLDNWAKPAMSHEGAVAALRFACKEAHDYAASDAMVSLMAAALAYFEKPTLVRPE